MAAKMAEIWLFCAVIAASFIMVAASRQDEDLPPPQITMYNFSLRDCGTEDSKIKLDCAQFNPAKVADYPFDIAMSLSFSVRGTVKRGLARTFFAEDLSKGFFANFCMPDCTPIATFCCPELCGVQFVGTTIVFPPCPWTSMSFGSNSYKLAFEGASLNIFGSYGFVSNNTYVGLQYNLEDQGDGGTIVGCLYLHFEISNSSDVPASFAAPIIIVTEDPYAEGTWLRSVAWTVHLGQKLL